MKAEEIRNNLIKGFGQEQAGQTDTPTFGKPKMFEPQTEGRLEITRTPIHLSPIRGLGFRDEIVTPEPEEKPYEIYSMKELISSNPEGMRTLSIEPKVMKAQIALVKRKEWQDFWLEDVDWLKPIDLTSGFKKMFHI